MRLQDWIIPQDKIFFQLLVKEAGKITVAVDTFTLAIDRNQFNKKTVLKIKELEEESDKVVNEIFTRLNQTFITPIDHEDIGFIAIAGDDIIDLLQAISRRVLIYRLNGGHKILKKFLVIIKQMIGEMHILMQKFDRLKQQEILLQARRIHHLENQGDDLMIETLENLMKKRDFKKMFQEKEVYEMLERLTDKIEDFCNVVQRVVMKNL